MTPPMENATPFQLGWFGVDLGPYRPCEYIIYDLYPFESLPPIRELGGTLDWLGPLDAHGDGELESRWNTEARGKLAEIEREAAQLGLTLPAAYVRLIASDQLLARIPDYAGRWFSWPERIVPCPGSTGGYIVSFLHDQQDCVVWYLYLTQQGEELVLGGHDALDELDEWNDGAGPTAEERAAVIANMWVCASSFEAFLYRYWLETTLHRKVHSHDDRPLTAEERRYLAHYEQQEKGESGS